MTDDYREGGSMHLKADLDGLTGIHTKRYFTEFLDREIAACSRHGHPLTLVIFEVDHFKQIKNTYGHIVGEVIPKDLVARIRPRILPGQLFARVGEDVFTCVLPSIALPGGIVFAEDLRKITEERPCSFENLPIPFTISLGVTTLHREIGVDPAALIKRADENPYIAKRSGRNRVVPSRADLVPT